MTRVAGYLFTGCNKQNAQNVNVFINSLVMVRNFIKIAFRNLRKSKGFTAINIIGLSLGMASSLLILLWVRDEYSVDAFHQQGDRLYTVYIRAITNGKAEGSYTTPGLLAEELKKDIPGIQSTCALAWTAPNTFSVGEKILKEEANHASSEFFTMFSYPLLAGDARSALSGPLSMAISRKMAVAFFGSPAAAMGKTIRYENQKDFAVSAVFEDLPANVSDRFDCLVNYTAFMQENDWLRQWGNGEPSTYVLLRPGTDVASVRKLLTHFMDTYIKPTATFNEELHLQRFDDRYLHSSFVNGHPTGGRIEYVRLFSLIALFILVIACINFMNLSTARSGKRAREIGVRKVIGAARGQLIRQFMGESVLLACMAALVALLLVRLALPAFNQLTGKSIALPFEQLSFWGILLLLTGLTGIFSGSYPALFLSAFNPVKVLKGTFSFGTRSLWFRKGLVVFQFVLSIVLIISTLLISQQVRYVLTKDLGYDRENLVYIPLDGDLPVNYEVFKNAARGLQGVGDISEISDFPTNVSNTSRDLVWEGKDPNFISNITQAAVGYDFARTMRLQFVQGRDFSKAFPADSNNFIINEAALAEIGYKDPIGRTLSFWGRKGTIIGVVKNFHFQSLHENINPLLLRMASYDNYSVALVRTRPGQTAAAIEGLGNLCKSLNPKFPFAYRFSDEEYAKLYKSDQVTGRLSVLFAVLAVLISCLGLLGLSMFSAEVRTKEIGIRKVLGAGVPSLFALLSREFVLLVGAAFVIAAPIGWWVMHQWLQQFAYRTEISWWIFGLSGVLALLTALATVTIQALKAVTANPVKNLRAE